MTASMSTWVDKLCKEYNAGKRQLIAYREKLDKCDRTEALNQEIEHVNGMISDLQYGITYMRTGRRPGSVRGYDSNDAYRYAELRDMDLIPALDLWVPEPKVTDEQKRLVINTLLKLSNRERQCFLLHAVQGMSYTDISIELEMSKGTVQSYVKRAKNKVQQAI